jgi:hypothetical protein
MNERIRQLAERASEIDGDDLLYYHPVFAKKFAELIVQKCADIGQQYADGNYEVYNQILEHFGVEQ